MTPIVGSGDLDAPSAEGAKSPPPVGRLAFKPPLREAQQSLPLMREVGGREFLSPSHGLRRASPLVRGGP